MMMVIVAMVIFMAALVKIMATTMTMNLKMMMT